MAKSPDTSVKDAVYKLQLSLLDGIHYEKQLFAAGTLLSTSDYKDVVTERSIANLCGYPLCTSPLPLDDRPRKGRYCISLKEHKVYDLQETRLFCCSDCLIKSCAFLTTLKNERQSEFDWGNVYEVLRLFGDLSFEEKQNNLGKPNNSCISELKITEKSDVEDGEASFENWIGPYNAIEGYVPRRESYTLPIKKKVSEAGIVILQSACEVDEGTVDVAEPDQSGIKLPKKPVLPDTDAFDAEDSWHDTPPEGFSLTLSSFATKWMTLIGWVSSSSIAYIYGCDRSEENEFSHANGREYPRKTVWSGRSSEIKRTLAVCFAQALPELASNLGIRTPISTLENAMGGLLETMSFCEALPSFNRKQWHVILLLFLDAFSVRRIPSITRHMTNIRTRMQKVLEGAQVTREEYEIMKDLLIPLGRVPEFSVLSGG